FVSGTALGQVFPQESDWRVLTSDGQPMLDACDASGEIDAVGSVDFPVAYLHRDTTHLYFRMRLNQTPVKSPGDLVPKGWGAVIDLDGDPSDYELLVLVDGKTAPDVVQLWRNTEQKNV